MTVPATSRRSPVYLGNDSATAFPFGFKVFSTADPQVVLTSASGASSTLVLNSDYTVTLNADQSAAPGGTINYPISGAPLPSGAKLVVQGQLPYNQTLALPAGGNYSPSALEQALDRLEMQIQQIAAGQDAALRAPVGEFLAALSSAASRASRVLAFDSAGNPITIPGVDSGSAAALGLDLASTASGKGSSLAGHNNQLAYSDATAGAALNSVVRVRDFPYLATSNGVSDDAAAIQAAVTWAGQAFDADWFSAATYARPRVVKLGRTHKVLSKILVPRGVVIDISDTTIIGDGTNPVFETAYFNAGVLTTNIGTAPETHRIQYTRFIGGRFVNCGKVFNLYNFNEGCEVKGSAFFNCVQPMVAERAFYAEFSNLTSRGSAGASTAWAFDFGFFVNVERIIGVTIVDRINPCRFQGAVNGQRIGIAVENCTNGIVFTGEVSPVQIGAGSYLESITNIGLDFTTASAHRAVEINGVFFNGMATAIKGVQMSGGQIGPNNYYSPTVAKHVDIQDVDSYLTVHIPPKPITSSGSLLPTKPSEYDLGTTVRAIYPQVITSSVDGTAQARCDVLVDHHAPLPWFGREGRLSGLWIWCAATIVNTGGTNYNLVITSKIAFDADIALYFAGTITDNIGTYRVCGNAAGATVYASSLAGKTVAIDADGNGYARLTIGSFSHPTGSITSTGKFRMQ